MEGSPVQMLQQQVLERVLQNMIQLRDRLSSPKFWICLILRNIFE